MLHIGMKKQGRERTVNLAMLNDPHRGSKYRSLNESSCSCWVKQNNNTPIHTKAKSTPEPKMGIVAGVGFIFCSSAYSKTLLGLLPQKLPLHGSHTRLLPQ